MSRRVKARLGRSLPVRSCQAFARRVSSGRGRHVASALICSKPVCSGHVSPFHILSVWSRLVPFRRALSRPVASRLVRSVRAFPWLVPSSHLRSRPSSHVKCRQVTSRQVRSFRADRVRSVMSGLVHSGLVPSCQGLSIHACSGLIASVRSRLVPSSPVHSSPVLSHHVESRLVRSARVVSSLVRRVQAGLFTFLLVLPNHVPSGPSSHVTSSLVRGRSRPVRARRVRRVVSSPVPSSHVNAGLAGLVSSVWSDDGSFRLVISGRVRPVKSLLGLVESWLVESSRSGHVASSPATACFVSSGPRESSPARHVFASSGLSKHLTSCPSRQVQSGRVQSRLTVSRQVGVSSVWSGLGQPSPISPRRFSAGRVTSGSSSPFPSGHCTAGLVAVSSVLARPVSSPRVLSSPVLSGPVSSVLNDGKADPEGRPRPSTSWLSRDYAVVAVAAPPLARCELRPSRTTSV